MKIDIGTEDDARIRHALDELAPAKPRGFEDKLGPYTTLVYDKGCNDPIGWGFEILQKLSDIEVATLKTHGDIEWIGSASDDAGTPLLDDEGRSVQAFGLVVRWLSAGDAERRYGARGEVTWGPRGGFKGVFYGERQFNHAKMRPAHAVPTKK